MSRAIFVALGILASRISGLVRSAATAAFLGVGPAADVLGIALRAPNLIQNLLGEQALSASFIPVYSRLLAAGKPQAAGRLAGAVLGLLTVVAATVALLGVLFARQLVAVVAPGFLTDAAAVASGTATLDRYALAVAAVRIVFPMTALLAVSAWALAVLNSHRRFLVPYLAPVAWNVAIITALALAGLRQWNASAVVLAACWGALLGGALQLLVQLPSVVRCLVGFEWSLSRRVEGVAETLRSFGPFLLGRGVVQLSSYLDTILATFLAAGAVSALDLAQRVYLLPISLFGAAVAAAELPELAELAGAGDRGQLARRVRAALAQAAGAAIPAALGILVLAPVVVGGLYARGRFAADDLRLVSAVLAVALLAVVPTVCSRLFQNSFYALGDTAFPARVAGLRVLVGAAVGVAAMVPLDRVSVAALPWIEPLGEATELRLGAVGLVLGLLAGSSVEVWALRRRLARELGPGLLPLRAFARSASLAAVAGGLAGALALMMRTRTPSNLGLAVVVVSAYAVAWVALATLARDPTLAAWLGRFARRRQRIRRGEEDPR